MSNKPVIQQLRRLRRFQSVVLVGSIALYLLCIGALAAKKLNGQTIQSSDPIVILTVVGSILWVTLVWGLTSAFGRQIPHDDDN